MKKILFTIFFIIFFITIYYTISPIYYIEKEKKEFSNLIEIKNTIINIPIESIEANNSHAINQYQKLYEINNDLIGWIKIDNTNIDYPVMFTPTNEDYYLSHNFYKQYSYSGTPFVSKNYSPNNNNIIIYGHNVNNQTLFSELINYQNESYYKTHQLIKFDILTQENDYQVIAVFKSRVFYEDEKVFKYYKMDYNLNENKFNYYIDNIKSLSLYHIDTSATYGDKLITLSTCYNEIEDGRFIVVAKLIR